MLGMATLRRWPVMHFDVPHGVPKFLGWNHKRRCRWRCARSMFPYVRFQLEGLEDPAEGKRDPGRQPQELLRPDRDRVPAVERGRTVRFLGKKEVFDAPVIGDLAAAMGGIRVDRGTGSEEPLQAAEEALAGGEMVALMPQGTIPAGRRSSIRSSRAAGSAMKLAHATGAQVIPVGIWGTEKVWPRSSKLPNMTNVLSPPTVWIKVGESRSTTRVRTSRRTPGR